MSLEYDPARIGKQLRATQLERMFRVIRSHHVDSPFGVVPAPSRFGDPEGRFSVLYASEAVRCSFWEAIVRNRFDRRKRRQIPRSDIESRWVVAFCSDAPLSLVDLTADGPIRIAAPSAVAHNSNHAAGRALSAATYRQVPHADGFLFQSRFTGHLCVAVFDRAIGKLQAMDVSALITHADLLDALDDYEITLTTPP
ncbi:MAG: RES domain-containing protein [Kiloniellales bacterium]|nr:RES domain-containing protein [Kiloniellales bacterium]